MKYYHYLAFGLTIRSEIEFPELLTIDTYPPSPEIIIRYGTCNSPHFKDTSDEQKGWQATENNLWLHVPDVAQFLIEEGQTITIDPKGSVDLASLRLFILGSCMGALLMQRNYFVLHGNAIQIGEQCISVVGHSGAGKSTLCGAFFKRGYPILADDVCAIGSHIEVFPSFPQIKLWKDSAEQLNIETQHLRRIRPHLEKFAIPLQTQYQKKSLPLCGIYELNSYAGNDREKKTITGLEKLKTLHRNTYRKHYLRGLNKINLHHHQSAQIANKIFVVDLPRSTKTFELDALVECIEKDLYEKGLL